MPNEDRLVVADTQAARSRRLAEHYLFDDTQARLEATAALAAKSLGFPFAQINILDEVYVHTIAGHKDGGEDTIPREKTMCQFTIQDPDRVLAVSDLPADPRFAQLEPVVEGVVGSYIGVALIGREGKRVGTLCVYSRVPKPIDERDVESMTQFGDIVEDQIERLRRASERQTGDTIAAASLSAAIDKGEIVPWYQPIIDIESDRVVAYEALARWYRPDDGVEDPRRFLPLAEDSDLVVDLDLLILRQALTDLRTFRLTHPGLRLNINISTRHLEIDGGVETLCEAVRVADIEPTAINLEVTETRNLHVGRLVIAAVAALRTHGFGVVIDDFGRGWSSLDRLLHLDVSGFKVDQTVVAALGTPIGDAMARWLASLANELDFDITIEGITNAEQLAAAKAFGYREAQGFFWTEPVPASTVTAKY